MIKKKKIKKFCLFGVCLFGDFVAKMEMMSFSDNFFSFDSSPFLPVVSHVDSIYIRLRLIKKNKQTGCLPLLFFF